jgi:hypothetical protein
MKNITIRVSDELGHAYKVWLAQNKTTQQEHLEGVLEEVTGVKNELSFKKTIKIKQKGELREALYKESYDKVAIYADGTWEPLTSGTHDYSAVYTISRPFFYDVSRKMVEKELEKIENILNWAAGSHPVSWEKFQEDECRAAVKLVKDYLNFPTSHETRTIFNDDGSEALYVAAIYEKKYEDEKKLFFEKYYVDYYEPELVPDEIIEITF